MNFAPARWLELGPYRVLAKPLHTNPAWLTHWIYRAGILIGKSLSVPSLSDCEHLERWGDQYATADQSHKLKPLALRGAIKERARAYRPGRPRKDDSDRELVEAISGD